FSIGRPNPGLALVSFLMMMILANGEKIITGFLDAGVVL
ncbi:pili assembly chaperone, partial [Klebsiella pneumoniae]